MARLFPFDAGLNLQQALSGGVPLASTTTFLPKDMMPMFQAWKDQYAPGDSGEDYDYQGAFLHGARPGPDGHWPDTWKKPNHPTFSNESIYAGLAKNNPEFTKGGATLPGHWEGDKFVPGKEQYTDIGTILPTRKNVRTGQKEWYNPFEPGAPIPGAYRPLLGLMGAANQAAYEGVDPLYDPVMLQQSMTAGENIGMPTLGVGALASLGAKEAFDPNTLFLFGGQRAKTANRGALQKAGNLYQKASKGWNPANGTIIPPQAIEDIFDKTGWFLGPDGEWRFTIPDKGVRFTKNVPNIDQEVQQEFAKQYQRFPNMDMMDLLNYARNKVPAVSLGNTKFNQEFMTQNGVDLMRAMMEPKMRMKDIIDHPELYAAYPDIAKMNTGLIIGPRRQRSGAYNMMSDDTFMQGPNMMTTLGTGLHELQHAIQNREFFSGGGDYPLTDFAMKRVLAENPGMDMPHQHDAYRALMGETEARAVQDRYYKGVGMGNPEIRGTPYAAQGYDIPPNKQIDRSHIEQLWNEIPGTPDYNYFLNILKQRLGALAGP